MQVFFIRNQCCRVRGLWKRKSSHRGLPRLSWSRGTASASCAISFRAIETGLIQQETESTAGDCKFSVVHILVHPPFSMSDGMRGWLFRGADVNKSVEIRYILGEWRILTSPPRVTMLTSAEDSSMSLVSGDVKSNFVFYTYLIATLLSILVHDGGLELDTLLFDWNSGGNLWSVPSATWVDMPTFMLIASISCQHPHIIHRSHSSFHVWWSAFLTRWFVEWRCGQVPKIRLCLWWVEMSKYNFVFLSGSCLYLPHCYSPLLSLHSGAWFWTGTGLSTFWWELWRKPGEGAFCNVSWHANFFVDC